MVVVGDDVEAVLIVDGREVWAITGGATQAAMCGNVACDDYGQPSGAVYPDEGILMFICAGCGFPVKSVEQGWKCSLCGELIVGDRDEFLRHAEQYHAPALY